jgi:hypothetical protein
MLWLAIGALAAHRRVARILGLGLIASIAMWLSYASIFVFAGAIGVLGVLALRQRDWRVVAACAVSAALVGISLMALMTVVKAQATPELMNFWKGRLIGAQTVSGMLLWIPTALAGISDYLLSPMGPVLLLLAVAGAAQLWIAGKSLEVSILLSPLVAAMAASLANRWPFGGNQHMVFAAATVFILAGNGFAIVAEALWARRRFAAAAFVLAVAAPPTGFAGYHLVVPRYRHEARTVIDFAERNQRPDDAMIVACPAEYEFYTGRKPPNVPATAKTRVWFIGTRSGKRPFPSQAVIDQLASRRPKLAAIEAPGAGAYLFGPETPASAVRQ